MRIPLQACSVAMEYNSSLYLFFRQHLLSCYHLLYLMTVTFLICVYYPITYFCSKRHVYFYTSATWELVAQYNIISTCKINSMNSEILKSTKQLVHSHSIGEQMNVNITIMNHHILLYRHLIYSNIELVNFILYSFHMFF